MFPTSSRILVVDDQKVMRLLVEKHLRDLGYSDIAESDDGANAWPIYVKALAEGKPFDLVISDMMMPLMSGIQFLIKIRSYHANKETPFLLVTAENDKDTVIKAMQWRVSGYIVKPFTPEVLVEKLKGAFEAAKKAA